MVDYIMLKYIKLKMVINLKYNKIKVYNGRIIIPVKNEEVSYKKELDLVSIIERAIIEREDEIEFDGEYYIDSI